MATKTLGTDSTSSLVAVVYSPAPSVLLPADLATINQDILTDDAAHAVAHLRAMGGFVREGLLYLPNNRGVVKILPGDVVAVDTTSNVGWPILVSANALANGAWTLV